MLKWNVYLEDFNSRCIKTYNIFEHAGFVDGCRKAARSCADDRDAFAEQLRRLLSYYFWCKCEYEIVLDAWPPSPRFRQEKIDVFDQVTLNFDVFIDWLWQNKAELLKKRRS